MFLLICCFLHMLGYTKWEYLSLSKVSKAFKSFLYRHMVHYLFFRILLTHRGKQVTCRWSHTSFDHPGHYHRHSPFWSSPLISCLLLFLILVSDADVLRRRVNGLAIHCWLAGVSLRARYRLNHDTRLLYSAPEILKYIIWREWSCTNQFSLEYNII